MNSQQISRRRVFGMGAAGVAATALGSTALGATALGGRAAPLFGPAAASTGRRCVSSVPFESGRDGYPINRTPGLVKTKQGTLLAFAQGRHDLDDSGDIDLLVRRSTDGGCTWGPIHLVADQGPDVAGTQAPIVTSEGRVFLLSMFNAADVSLDDIRCGDIPAEKSRRVFIQHSDDDGRTWSPLREITDQAKLPDWRWYATGPGHGIQLRRGPHAGRLFIACDHSRAPDPDTDDTGCERRYWGAHGLYSDDLGETWQIGYVDDNTDAHVKHDETTAAELPDGRIYLSMRTGEEDSAPGNRADAYSPDGGESLTEPFQPNETVVTPTCQGSLLQPSRRGDVLLYSGPSDASERVAMAIRVSRDRGATWRVGLTLSDLPAAYSDLVELDLATVGILYETGEDTPYGRLEFRRIPMADLLRRTES